MKDNWKYVTLSDFVDLKHGYQFRDTDFTENGIPIIKIGNVWEKGLNLENVTFISKKRYDIFKSYEIMNGDILMSLTGNIGRVVEVKGLSSVVLQNYRVGNFFSKDETVLGKQFIKWILGSKSLLEQLDRYSNQSAQANFGKQDLDKLKFYLPPIPQQRKIATILSTCDEVIEKTEAAIAKYQALKQGMMHDLFTRGIDLNTGKLRPSYQDVPELYKESELGMIPMYWEVYRLDDVIEKYLDFRGKTPLKLGMNWGGGDIRALSANNVQMGAVNFDKECYYGSNNLYNKWMNKGDCEKGDVLMTMEAPLGNVAQVPDDKKYILSQRTILLKNKREKLIKDFMYYLFCNNSFQSSLFINSTGSTVRGIQQKKLARIKVIIPKNIKEQNIVALKLKAVDSKINIEQSALAKYQQLKAGLMQDLLTGKVEVSVAEAVVKN